MRLVLDSRIYGPRHGGLGRYVQQLCLGLPSRCPDDSFTLLLGDVARADYLADVGQVPANVQLVEAPWRWYTWAEQRQLPQLVNSLKPDLTHYPHLNVPLGAPQPFVVTVHDLIIHRFPTSRATTLPTPLYWAKLAAYRLTVRRAVARAAAVIVPTQFVADDLAGQYRRAVAQKLRVTWEGVAAADGRAADVTEVLERYGIVEPFLLYVGSAYPHKDLPTALRAFQVLRRRGLARSFVHVWRPDEFLARLQRQARREGSARGVVWTGYVPDAELAALYRAAAAYVFPSRYEGFGLPPLEAQAHGCPVVAAQASCLPEVLGESAAWFEVGRVGQLVSVLEGVLTDRLRREALVSAGRENVRRFSWNRTVDQTAEVYRAAAGQGT